MSLGIAQPVLAQDTPLVSGIITLDPDVLYAESKFGQSIEAAFAAELDALSSDNRRLESALEAEEQALTARRATLAAEEFQRLAQEFDAKVEGLRQAQDAKSRDITSRRDAARLAFFDQAKPALTAVMAERGAGAILDRTAILLGFDTLDVTARAIEVLDALHEGKPYPALPAAPATEPTAPVPEPDTSAGSSVPQENPAAETAPVPAPPQPAPVRPMPRPAIQTAPAP